MIERDRKETGHAKSDNTLREKREENYPLFPLFSPFLSSFLSTLHPTLFGHLFLSFDLTALRDLLRACQCLGQPADQQHLIGIVRV